MTDINKPKEEEVPTGDKPESKEVEGGAPMTPEAIAKDMLAGDGSTPASTDETKPETEDKPDEIVFAKVGNREFKTQEELIQFASETDARLVKTETDLNSQKGFNGWITGAVKKMRPDLFEADGSIKSAELQKIVEGASAKAGEAAEVLKEHAGKTADELTDEEKADIEKARNILKPLGVVFADDPRFKKMEEDLTRYRERDLDQAQAVIEQFSTKHADCKDSAGNPTSFDNHRAEVGQLMEDRGYDNLEKAWKVYKAEQDITEEQKPNADIKKDDAGGNRSVDTTIPTVVKKESGSLPSSGKTDIWDEVLNLSTLPR